MQKIPVHKIIEQLDSYYSKENFKNAKELINFWSQAAIKFEDRGGQLTLENELIGLVRRTGEEMEGLAAIDRALLIIDRKMVSDETAVATTWLNCGTTYECFGYFDEALSMYLQAREVYERILAPEDPKMGGLYNNMAYVYRAKGKTGTAEELTQKAIEIMLANQDLQDAAVSYVNLAEIYEEMRSYLMNECDDNSQLCENPISQIRSVDDNRNSEDDLLYKIDNCLMTAYKLLKDPSNVQNGDYAYSLKKCVSGYEHFGYDTIARELSVKAQEIYAGNRAGKEIL